MQELELIKEKILKKDFVFDQYEQEEIETSPELMNLIANELEKIDDWSEEEFRLFERIASSVNITEDLAFKYAKGIINYDMYSVNDILEDLQNYLYDKEKISIIEKMMKELSLSGKASSIHHTYLMKLLKDGDYETISRLTAPFEIYDDSVIDVFKEEYPFEEYGFPESLNGSSYIVKFEEQIPYMSLQTLSLFSYYYVADNESLKNKIKEAILKKVFDKDEIKKIKYFPDFVQILQIMDNENRQKIDEFLFANGVYINRYLIEKKLEEDPSYLNIIIDNIKHNDLSYNSFLTCFEPSFSEEYNFLEYNDEVLNILLEKGALETILAFSADNPKKEEYLEKIANEIVNGNPIYINLLNNDPYLGSQSEIISRACLKTPLITKLEYNRFYSFGGPLYLEFLEYLGANPNTEIDFRNQGVNETVCIELYKSGRYITANEVIINIFNPSEKLKLAILEAIEKSDECAETLTNGGRYFAKNIIYNEKDQRILKALITKNRYCAKYVLETINEDANLAYLYNEEIFNLFKPFILNRYNIKEENLTFIEKELGPEILRYIDNENIHVLLNLLLNQMKKILAIFPRLDFNLTDTTAIYDIIKQYEFPIKYPEIVNIFSDIMHSIEEKSERYQELLVKIAPFIDKQYFKMASKKYEIPEKYQKNPLDFLKLIVNKIIYEPEKAEKYTNILQDVVNYYIEHSREEYSKTYTMDEDFHISYKPDPISEMSYKVDYVIKNSEHIFNRYFISFFFEDVETYPNNFEELISLKMPDTDPSLISDVIHFLRDPHCHVENDMVLVNRKIKEVKKAVKTLIEEHEPLFRTNIPTDTEEYSRRVKQYPEITARGIDYYALLSLLRLDIIVEKLLPDEQAYNSLIATMKKRKIHLIPFDITEFLNNQDLDIKYSLDSVIAFINYYYKIYKKALDFQHVTGENDDKKRGPLILNLPDILKESKAYLQMSSVYAQILTPEDANLIVANSGTHRATNKVKNNERLVESIDWTINNFKRQKLTVPPLDEIVEINGKRVRCVVGNFTHPCNLTHGERTDACMRIGGVGESLYAFALQNENGFHIRFEDAETGEYISRVTCFRNGNSIFCNQLRSSCIPDYSDEEVVDVCRKVSHRLIEESVTSSYPIDNVVISRAYATLTMDSPLVGLGVDSIKTGLPPFYSDVSTKALIMATSDNDKLVPLTFNEHQMPEYRPCRERITETRTLDQIVSTMNRIHAINSYMATGILTSVEPLSFDNGFTYCIANQDWYIYVDENNEIHEEIIDIDPRARIELTEAREKVQQMLNSLEEQRSEKHGL